MGGFNAGRADAVLNDAKGKVGSFPAYPPRFFQPWIGSSEEPRH